MSRSRIAGVGMYVPPNVLTNADFEKMVETTDAWILTRTGMKVRHIATEEMASSDLSTKAAQEALQKAGMDAADLDLIVVGTISPDHAFPSTACLVQANLGNKKAACFDVSAACPGFLHGLSIADQYIKCGKYKNALVIGTEILSKITNYEDRNTCVLFGDGAGAVVLQVHDGDEGVIDTLLGSDGTLAQLLIQPAGGSRMPASHETVDKKLHSVFMAGNEVFKNAVRAMEAAAEGILERNGVDPSEIALCIPHQANIRIIEALQKRLGLPDEKVFVNIHRYGNISSATIPIGIYEALQEGRIKPGDLVLLVSFGAGFVWASALVRF
jgi:3-oxoacyl-[acyl-carrier-protein] synthase III